MIMLYMLMLHSDISPLMAGGEWTSIVLSLADSYYLNITYPVLLSCSPRCECSIL